MSEVRLIAYTEVDWVELNRAQSNFRTDALTDGEALIEYAGRACYQSWPKPNPATATISGYLENIRSQGHFSVYEHAVATFDFRKVSRSFTHELIRHRHFSFSELSQRFVDVEKALMILPPALTPEFVANADDLAEATWSMRRAYRSIFDYLTGHGLGRKQAREAARSVMPNMTETHIVVTGNLRTWRHFIKVRGTVHADAEIRAVTVKVARLLADHYRDAMADVEFYHENDQLCVRLKGAESE